MRVSSKTMAVVSVSLMICLSLAPVSGCSATSNNSEQPGTEAEYAEDSYESEYSMTLAAALEAGNGLYVLDGDNVIYQDGYPEEIDYVYYDKERYDNSAIWKTYGSSFNKVKEQELPIGSYSFVSLDYADRPYAALAEGNSLISIGEDALDCAFYKVVKDGYWPGFDFRIWEPSENYNPEYPVGDLRIDGEEIDIAEFNGVDVTNPVDAKSSPGSNAALAEIENSGLSYECVELAVRDVGNIYGSNYDTMKHYILCSEESEEYVDLGYYSGSTFDESTIHLSDYYYFAKKTKVDVKRTKNGYCVADTSSLDKGKYLVSMSSGDDKTWLAFEIV